MSPSPKLYRQHRTALPAGACDVLLVRHGESMPGQLDRPFSTWRSADSPREHADPPLAPDGEQQALRLADRLISTRIDAIYVTPLQRTQQTIAPLAAKLGITPAVEPDLVEVHLGDWEGVLWRQKSEERDPVAVRAFAEQRWDVVPGAEPAAELFERVRRGIDRIGAAHPDERVIVVAHGGVIAAAMSIASGSGAFAFIGADNASISQLFVQPGQSGQPPHPGRWVVRGFNDVAHLDPTLSVMGAAPAAEA